MVITLISKVLGFVREIILASNFGASHVTDAYLTALNIPVVIFAGVSASLATTYIPMFYSVKEKEGKSGVYKFTDNVYSIVVLCSLILIAIGFAFTPYIVKLFAVGFNGNILDLTVDFSKILMPAMLFLAINSIQSAYLQANNKFYISAASTIPFNIICIIAIIIGANSNAYTMVYITLFAYIAQMIFQFIFVKNDGYKYKLHINLGDKNIHKLLYLVIPVFIGSYVDQINTMINRSLASTIEVGAITALNYASKLNVFATGIIVMSLSTVLYPILSRLSSENNMEMFKRYVTKSVNLVVVFMIPITFMTMVLATPIVKVLFEKGSFNSHDTYLTSIALFYYSIGMVAYGVRDVLSRTFYSLQDTKTPVKNAAISVLFNIVLSLILVKVMGIGGLALSTSIAGIIAALLLGLSLRKKIGKLGMKNTIKNFIKVQIASFIMGIFMNLFLSKGYLLGLNLIVLCIASVIIGTLIYILMAFILNINEIKDMIKSIKEKIVSKFN
jgi:putative peptidoglycan lipid II flippase